MLLCVCACTAASRTTQWASHGPKDGFPIADYCKLATKLGAAVRTDAELNKKVTLVGPAVAGIDLEASNTRQLP